MALTGTAPLIQAVVQTLRANVTLKAAVSGFYEGLAPRGVRRPFVIYQIAYAPYTYDFGSQNAIQTVGIYVFAIS